MSLPETYSVPDVAQAIDMSAYYVTQQCREGRFPHLRFGRRIRFTAEHVAQILAAHEQRPVTVESVRGLTKRSAARRRRAS